MSATTSTPATPIPTGWYTPGTCDVREFADLVEQTTDVADYPHADEVVQGVLVYGARLRRAAEDPEERRAAQTELARALSDGPGIVVFRDAAPGETRVPQDRLSR